MKKKLLSLLLVLSLLFTLAVFPVESAASESSRPILYITGQGNSIRDKDGKVVYDGSRVPIPDGLIEDMVQELVPLFIKAITLGQWDAYRESFLNKWVPIYENVALDKNGENTNGSYTQYTWQHLNERPNFTFGSYHFTHDWRLDPMANADGINVCVNEIKQMTGADKIDVIVRCEAVNIFLAYLAKYGYDSVNHMIIHVSAVNGVDTMGALFSGDIVLDPRMLRDFYYNKVVIGDEALTALLNAVVDYLVESYGFEGACELLEKAVPMLYNKIGSDMILTSYGSFPGIWAVVGPDYYAKARKVIFKGKEEEYAGLIEKLDNYDVMVRQRIDDILLEAADSGVKISVVAKYDNFGYKAPFCKEMYEYNDDAICVRNASFGATSAKIGETFSEKYLSSADAKYISPDKCVDASTCLFPGRTWFMKGADHDNFDTITDQLLSALLRSDGEMTVDSDPAFPQYLQYTSGGIIPLTVQEETDTPAERTLPRIIRLIKQFFNLLRELFSFLKNK